MTHETNRIQSKVHNIRTYRINKVYLSCYNDKKYIYLTMHTVGYHIFINLLVNHRKNDVSNIGNLF